MRQIVDVPSMPTQVGSISQHFDIAAFVTFLRKRRKKEKKYRTILSTVQGKPMAEGDGLFSHAAASN